MQTLVIQRNYDNDVGLSETEGCLLEEKDKCYSGSLFSNKVMYPDPGKTGWIPSKLKDLINLIKDTHNTDIAGKHFTSKVKFKN